MFGNAIQLIDYSKLLTPKYFECNLISAELYKSTRPLKAKEEYGHAIRKCENNDEIILSLIQFSDFLIRSNDYEYAIELLMRAESLDSSCIEVRFQKAKTFSYIGRYDDAGETLSTLNILHLNDHFSNMLLTARADILRRKSEMINIRETKNGCT